MESHASNHTSAAGIILSGLGGRRLALCLAIVLMAAATALAESQIADLEPGPHSYQHAQLMADAHAKSFGERRPPAPYRVIVRNDELDDLCGDLDVLQGRLRETEQKLDELNRAMGPGPRREPLREGGDDIAALNHRRERLAERADRQTIELRELREHLADRERQITSELRGIYARMQDIERELTGLDRRRQERLDRLMAARNQLLRIEARLRDLMAQVEGMQRHVADRMEGNHRQREAIHNAIERTRQEAERVRDQLEEVRRAPLSAPEPTMRPRRTWAPPRPIPAPPTPSPDPALETELQLLREEVSQLRQQLREAPKRMEVICIRDPHAVGSARGYYWPCR